MFYSCALRIKKGQGTDQRPIDVLLTKVKWQIARVYKNDIVVFFAYARRTCRACSTNLCNIIRHWRDHEPKNASGSQIVSTISVMAFALGALKYQYK